VRAARSAGTALTDNPADGLPALLG